jgi:hypothetical protein
MRIFPVILIAALAGGCAGGKKWGVRVKDPYDGVRIDQMVGNNVSGQLLARTVVCLNARRETRTLTVLTNQTVVLLTNVSLSYLTNLTFTVSTNRQLALATNEVAATPPAPAADTNSTGETTTQAATPTPPAATNVMLTTASNVSASKAGNATVLITSAQRQRSRQVTTTRNNLAVTIADNENASAETNLVVTVVTNVTVTCVTNLTVTLTNQPVHEYFLTAEYTPPPDFTLQSGESLVLLVDGVRRPLPQATSPSVLVPRRGFAAALYHATPQLLVDIANAKQVKLRLKGVNAVIEKNMSASSRANFRQFLLKYFTPDDSCGATPATATQPNS